MEPPPPLESQRRRYVAYLLVGGLIGAGIGIWLGDRLTDGSELGFWAVFLLFWYVVIGVHEAGHILAGSLTGFRCHGAMICSLRLLRTTQGWRLGYEWRRTWCSGGMAYLTPISLDPADWQCAVMLAAGPVCSLLLLAATLAVPLPAAMESARWPAVLGAGIVAAISLLPINAGNSVSDVARLLALARRTDDWQRWKLLLRFGTANVQGVPPREWDAEALRAAASLTGGRAPNRYRARILAYIAAVDRREYAEAARFLESALGMSGSLGAPARSLIFLEAAFFQARRNHNAAAGRAWLEDAGKGKGLPRFVKAAAEAAVLLAEGKPGEAAGRASFALAQVKRRAIEAATTRQAIDTLEELLADAESGRSAAAASR